MDETILRNEINKLATNFRDNVDVEQIFNLWKDVFRNVSDTNFILAVSEIIKDKKQKGFPNVVQVKRRLQEISKFIPGKTGNCSLCCNGFVIVNVFNYDFTFVCPCSHVRYPDMCLFKCNTCTYYSELYQPSGQSSKRICNARDITIKPIPCEWVIKKFRNYFYFHRKGGNGWKENLKNGLF